MKIKYKDKEHDLIDFAETLIDKTANKFQKWLNKDKLEESGPPWVDPKNQPWSVGIETTIDPELSFEEALEISRQEEEELNFETVGTYAETCMNDQLGMKEYYDTSKKWADRPIQGREILLVGGSYNGLKMWFDKHEGNSYLPEIKLPLRVSSDGTPKDYNLNIVEQYDLSYTWPDTKERYATVEQADLEYHFKEVVSGKMP